VEIGVSIARTMRRLGALAAVAACHAPVATARPALAQGASQTGLIPAGYGSLRRDDIAVKVQSQGLIVTAIPLEENVIRTLSPDSYGSLRAQRESLAGQLDSIRSRMGLPSVQAWYVMFSNVEQGEARFDPSDFLVRSAGRDFRPLRVLPLTPGFGNGRLAQRETQSAIYAFDSQIDLSQPITVTIGTQQSMWGSDVLQRVESERSRVWARAAGRP
jgi:hypothetical protein